MKMPWWGSAAASVLVGVWMIAFFGDLTFSLDTPWLWWSARAVGLVSDAVDLVKSTRGRRRGDARNRG